MSGDERSGSPPEEGESRFENVAALARQAKPSPAIISATTDKNGQAHRQLTLGEVVREEGIARAEEGTDSWWRNCCDEAISEMARRGCIFQAADLLDLGLTEPDHPNRWGPRLLAAARAGVIEPVGYTSSKRPSTAMSAVRLWRGTR